MGFTVLLQPESESLGNYSRISVSSFLTAGY